MTILKYQAAYDQHFILVQSDTLPDIDKPLTINDRQVNVYHIGKYSDNIYQLNLGHCKSGDNKNFLHYLQHNEYNRYEDK